MTVPVERGCMFCPTCPAVLVIAEVEPGQPLRAFTADPTTGARLTEHVCPVVRRPRSWLIPLEGDVCAVHGRVHNSHGWYACVPDGSGHHVSTPDGVVVWQARYEHPRAGS